MTDQVIENLSVHSIDELPPTMGEMVKVENIAVTVRSMPELKPILTRLDPDYLIKIDLRRSDESQHLPYLHLDEIAPLEQWKHASEMDISQFSVKFSIDHIAHFTIGKVVFEEVTVDQILDLFKVLNESETFKYFEVNYINIDNPAMLVDIIGPPYEEKGRIGPKRLRYGIGSDHDYLLIELHLPLIKIRKTTVEFAD